MLKDTQHTPLNINVTFALTLILPLVISFFHPAWRFAQFTPRQLIYRGDFWSLVTAFWASPTHIFGQLSRILQAGIIACFPWALAVHILFAFWVLIALGRTLSGFLLSRAVGWAYPRLFNHWALYETSSGIGPALAVYLIVYGWPWTTSFIQKIHSGITESLIIVTACLSLCWLDHASWTYAIASITSVVVWLTQAMYTASLRRRSHNPKDARRLSAVLQTAMLLLVIIPVPTIVANMFPSKTWHMPTSADSTRPFLEVLILSYPRPGDTASPSLLSQTISSYLPYADTNTAVSVFTHATVHASFAHARDHFSQSPITFYTDMDTHEDSNPSQHLHVAEAFRWASEKASRAEWVMLVEDDFPVCGEWGWQGILAVMNRLQHDGIYGGFVGTGGSGLIIHHTLLPILMHMLRTYALRHSPLPPSVSYLPADIIIQDCLFGAGLLCPRNVGEPTLVITSRLVMDHIGGSASTAGGRWYSAEKWRCGWRHPFHGLMGADVVPV